MLIDCHNHTHNSPDGENESVLERCARAAELGIGVLAVTDHCEVNRFFSLAHYGVEPNGYDTYDFGRDFELSMQENTAAKAHTPAGVKLLCGIELGQATHELALAEHVYADVRLDFVIGSMHQLPGWDDFAFLDYSKVDAAALFHENLQEIARLASTDTYDVLGHITADYPPTYVMTSYYDFLKENAQPMYEFLKGKGIPCAWKCYGSEDKKYMAHVCHVNMNLEEAKEINQDECAFFRKYMV